MRISFSPYAALPGSSDTLAASVIGDHLTLNGDDIDFAVLADGDRIANGYELHPCLMGPIERVDGVLNLTMLLPYRNINGHVSAPPSITIDNGDIPIPVITEGT